MLVCSIKKEMPYKIAKKNPYLRIRRPDIVREDDPHGQVLGRLRGIEPEHHVRPDLPRQHGVVHDLQRGHEVAGEALGLPLARPEDLPRVGDRDLPGVGQGGVRVGGDGEEAGAGKPCSV